jgi:hypothetical protein
MILPLTTQKQNQRRHCLHQSACLVRCPIVTLPTKSLVCSFFSTPLIQTNRSAFLPTGFPFRKNLYSQNRTVSHAAAVLWLCQTAFIQLSLLLTNWVEKVVKIWVKQRWWDRPFGKSKLRQQGSPTIFAVEVNPTISRFSVCFKQEIRFTAISACRFPLPQLTPFFARSR